MNTNHNYHLPALGLMTQCLAAANLLIGRANEPGCLPERRHALLTQAMDTIEAVRNDLRRAN
jgi:hypothetical protein